MFYNSADEWHNAREKRVLIFGMSGLGKTHVANMLRDTGEWYHYSIDYRIGTRYMGEHILDNIKREAMKEPFIANLLRTDSIYIGSNISFNNLAPLSTYLGKPGDPAKGGVPFDEYMRRQALHREAEIASLLDSRYFIDRAQAIYGYPHFICDTGGSICEVVEPNNPDDPVLSSLSQDNLLVWIKGDDSHIDRLAARFDRAPKPMYYSPAFLTEKWSQYLSLNGVAEDKVDPDDFVRWTYRQAMKHREPIYAAMAEKWGVTVMADDVANVSNATDFDRLIADALGKQAN
ncbi:hypothetical protein RB2150_03134 [Rhodobacterales bacterium HTCC2150]|nr:hypothetical protein RB2150_03134 [Rhodobacterales bacterium HTCC2150] [Rhodobacteraceae bacterium HTCC2150]